jgi:uncharacterized protein related to proFAR isomerase
MREFYRRCFEVLIVLNVEEVYVRQLSPLFDQTEGASDDSQVSENLEQKVKVLVDCGFETAELDTGSAQHSHWRAMQRLLRNSWFTRA